MSHLGVPHLPFRKADGFAARGQRGAREFLHQAVHHRSLRETHGVPFGLGIQSPAVENDQSGERTLRSHGGGAYHSAPRGRSRSAIARHAIEAATGTQAGATHACGTRKTTSRSARLLGKPVTIASAT